VGAVKVVAVLGGTVGGIGAILAYAPPHQASAPLTPSPAPSSTPTTAQPSPAESATPTPSEAPTTPTTSAAPATPKASPIKSKTSAPKKIEIPKAPVNGTFTGEVVTTQYGPVEVQIDVIAGKIVNARALQLPSNPPNDPQFNAKVAKYLVQETVKVSLDNFQGVGGASITSQGWYDSLYSAVARAGL
jgi:uncharacterized protein with FMN-binding domain